MDPGQDRRVREDRRTAPANRRLRNERRSQAGNRRAEAGRHLWPDFTPLYAQSPQAAAGTIEHIAQAFGVAPESLELIENDDFVDGAEIGHPAEVQAQRTEKLEHDLAASRKEAERYRNQVKELLQSFNSHLQ